MAIVTVLVSSFSFGQNGLDFDGNNDIVNTNFAGVLGTANRTFEAWIYVSLSAPSSNLCITDYGGTTAGSRNTFVVTSSRALSFISGGTNANISSSANDITAGQWTHVAFVLNNGTGFLYVNGVQVGTGSLTSVNTPGIQNFRIGERVSGGSIPFEGVIDEVRVWDYARTQSEIAADMNGEFCAAPTGLVAYYKLNEGTAGGSNAGMTTTLDNSTGGNNGTLQNFALTGTTSNWVTGSGIATASPATSSQTFSVCQGDTVVVGTSTYTSTGVYTDIMAGGAVSGCDSIITTDITFLAPATSTQSFTGCDGFSVTVGSNTYTSSGIYFDTLVGASSIGCDSIVTTAMTVYAPVEVATVTSGTTITADNNNLSLTYQWLDCDNGYAVIPGETGMSYTPTLTGNYAVEVTDGSCVDTPACVSISFVGMEELNTAGMAVMPNPAKDYLKIVLEDKSPATIIITDNAGKQHMMIENIVGEIELDVRHLTSGVYHVSVTNDHAVYSMQKIVKL